MLLRSIYETPHSGSTLSELQARKAGVERDNVPVADKTAALSNTLQVELIVSIHCKYLTRANWEGSKMICKKKVKVPPTPPYPLPFGSQSLMANSFSSLITILSNKTQTMTNSRWLCQKNPLPVPTLAYKLSTSYDIPSPSRASM